MSLRLKFLILIVGAIVTPFVVFFISYQFNTRPGSLGEHRSLISMHHSLRRELRGSPVDVEELDTLLTDLPVEIRAFDDSGNLVFERRPENFPESKTRFQMSETIPVEFTSGETGTIIVTRPPSPLKGNDEMWYVPLTGLVFTAVMVVIIVQSVNRSISNLDKATRRIAEGDLDFELPIKGRDKLASLTRSFERMREHLKEEYAKRSRFIMGISHDLKTPLASVRGYADAIRDGYADTPEKLKKYLGIIDDKTKLLESRITMLIDYVQRESSDWKLNLQPVSVMPLFTEINAVLESEVGLSGRKWVANIQLSEGFEIPIDEGMFIRAMENLAQNAIRYSPDNSAIRFSGIQTDAAIFVAISNEGPGIAPADLPHIFDPFVRGAKDRKGPGIGLGLSTVEAVISSHGWQITASSKPGETTFTIVIPLVDDAV